MKRIVLASLLLAPISASADDVKKIDFMTPVIVDGTPIIDDFKCPLVDGKRKCETPFTVGEVVFWSLQRPAQGQTWAIAVKRNDLSRAVRTAKDFPLLPDQLATIEDAIGSLQWSPATVGAIAAVIDPK